VQRDDNLLPPEQPDNYYILTGGPDSVNGEPWLVHTISADSGTRMAAFRDAVRERGGRCVIAGTGVKCS
jgi:hypothetical protein